MCTLLLPRDAGSCGRWDFWRPFFWTSPVRAVRLRVCLPPRHTFEGHAAYPLCSRGPFWASQSDLQPMNTCDPADRARCTTHNPLHVRLESRVGRQLSTIRGAVRHGWRDRMGRHAAGWVDGDVEIAGKLPHKGAGGWPSGFSFDQSVFSTFAKHWTICVSVYGFGRNSLFSTKSVLRPSVSSRPLV